MTTMQETTYTSREGCWRCAPARRSARAGSGWTPTAALPARSGLGRRPRHLQGVDVSDRGIGLSVAHPRQRAGGQLEGGACTSTSAAPTSSSRRCSTVFTGQLGGAVADLAALIGEVVAVERAPITCDRRRAARHLSIGDVVDGRAGAVHRAPPASRPRCRTPCSARSRAPPPTRAGEQLPPRGADG